VVAGAAGVHAPPQQERQACWRQDLGPQTVWIPGGCWEDLFTGPDSTRPVPRGPQVNHPPLPTGLGSSVAGIRHGLVKSAGGSSVEAALRARGASRSDAGSSSTEAAVWSPAKLASTRRPQREGWRSPRLVDG
jgi:hypothetical protein